MSTAPPWFNHPASGALNEWGTQRGATCGLFAVNHAAASAVVLHGRSLPVVDKFEFERRGLAVAHGDEPTRLVQPGGSNYDFTLLHTNLGALGFSVFPMTVADLEGTAGRASLIARSRFDEPFAEHAISEGSFRTMCYLLRIPSHGGHWITLCRPEVAAGVEEGA